MVTVSMRLVALPPRLSSWANEAAKSMNFPCTLEVMSHWATTDSPAPIVPIRAVSDGSTGLTSTWVPRIEKSTSRPFSFSTIFGCAEVTVKSLAVPWPVLVTISPTAKASEGSVSSVCGSSP